MQKYNCHKVNEFVVGTTSKVEGQVDKFTVDLFTKLLDKSTAISQDIRQVVDFYHEVLQEEARNGKDLEYWIDHIITHGGTGHLAPVHASMSFVEFHNVLSWAAFAAIFTLSYGALCYLCCSSKQKAKEPDVKTD